VLRRVFGHIDLDRRMQPIRADWLVPEWRA
jgi:hypothetical protein